LLVAMARATRGVNLRQLAERRGWNWRAAYRDIETLCEAGVPVEHPEHGWYRVPDHWIPPGTVDVKRDELLALFVARQLAPGLKDTLVGRALDSLWAKLSTPGHQPMLALGDDSWLQTRGPGAIDYGPHRVVLDTVRAAIRERRALQIRYRKPDGAESERIIEPAVVRWDPAAEALYVFAWCREREAMRMFAIHRIVDAQLTDEAFAPRREAVVEMSKAFRLWSRSKVERVALRFSPRVAGEVRERRWHASERMTDTADGGVVLEMEVGAPEELERWLLGYGADVEVEAPASLAARIRERHAEAAGPTRLGLLRAARVRRPAGVVRARRRARSGV
jgi:predicted DNA-binding transcriptional regulator YafY